MLSIIALIETLLIIILQLLLWHSGSIMSEQRQALEFMRRRKEGKIQGWRWWIGNEMTGEKVGVGGIKWIAYWPSLLSCRNEKSPFCCHLPSTLLFYCCPRGHIILFSLQPKGATPNSCLTYIFLALITTFFCLLFFQASVQLWHSISIIRKTLTGRQLPNITVHVCSPAVKFRPMAMPTGPDEKDLKTG